MALLILSLNISATTRSPYLGGSQVLAIRQG
jgi:hypothetical protein